MHSRPFRLQSANYSRQSRRHTHAPRLSGYALRNPRHAVKTDFRVRPEAGRKATSSNQDRTMKARALQLFSLVDVIGIPVFVSLFIWKLQFTTRNSWIAFPLWLLASFLLHRESPKTL